MVCKIRCEWEEYQLSNQTRWNLKWMEMVIQCVLIYPASFPTEEFIPSSLKWTRHVGLQSGAFSPGVTLIVPFNMGDWAKKEGGKRRVKMCSGTTQWSWYFIFWNLLHLPLRNPRHVVVVGFCTMKQKIGKDGHSLLLIRNAMIIMIIIIIS